MAKARRRCSTSAYHRNIVDLRCTDMNFSYSGLGDGCTRSTLALRSRTFISW